MQRLPAIASAHDRRVWSRVFSSAWDSLKSEQRNGADLPIDPYALESPAEFFAVASEQFFEDPATLRQHSRRTTGSSSNFIGSIRSEPVSRSRPQVTRSPAATRTATTSICSGWMATRRRPARGKRSGDT